MPSTVPNTLTLNFEGGADDIPTYSLADLRACVEKDDKDFFRRHFDGKVVLIGTVLDLEDRKLTSKRFATAPKARARRAARCRAPSAGQAFTRDSIAGVYIHATAVNNLIRGDALHRVRADRHVALIAFALSRCWPRSLRCCSRRLPRRSPTLGLVAAWTRRRPLRSAAPWRLPLIEPLLAGLLALGATIGYRFVVADRGQAPAAPELRALSCAAGDRPDDGLEQAAGARRRDAQRHGVSSPTSPDFSSFAEKLPPAELVAADERVPFGDDRHHRGAWRLRRQVHRRRHRRGVRRAARRSRSCDATRCAPRCNAPRRLERAQPHPGRVPGGSS